MSTRDKLVARIAELEQAQADFMTEGWKRFDAAVLQRLPELVWFTLTDPPDERRASLLAAWTRVDTYGNTEWMSDMFDIWEERGFADPTGFIAESLANDWEAEQPLAHYSLQRLRTQLEELNR